jgi:hypothetical protein
MALFALPILATGRKNSHSIPDASFRDLRPRPEDFTRRVFALAGDVTLQVTSQPRAERSEMNLGILGAVNLVFHTQVHFQKELRRDGLKLFPPSFGQPEVMAYLR